MAPDARGLRRKRSAKNTGRRWVALRKLSQFLALLIFLVFFVMTRLGGEQAELWALPMRLDPLIMLAHLLSSKVWLVSSSLALVTIILTLVFFRG